MLEDRRPTRRSILLALFVLVSLVYAVFFRMLGFELVNLDISEPLVHNPYIRGLTGENLKQIFSSWCLTSYYPIRSLSYAIDYQIWGPNPAGLKLTNSLLHLANVFLVFWLVLRLSRHPSAACKSVKPWWGVSVATFSAGIFAVHPVVVEPVTWLAGREELLMTLGALGCVHFHLSGRLLEEAPGKARGVLACRACAILCCAVACLSNAVAAVVPLLITAWDVLLLTRPKLWRIISGTSALWVIGAAAIVLKKLGGSAVVYVPEAGMFSAERLMVVLNVYWLNLKTVVWPRHLTASYGNVTPEGFTDVEVILGGTAFGLTCLALWFLRRRKMILLGLVWFGLALGPTSQILPHHVYRADRFLYLPLVGLTLAMAMGLRPLGDSLKSRAAVGGVVVAGLLALLTLETLSAGQVQTWRNSLSMWKNCVRVAPANAFAHSCLAECLAEEGRFDQAISHYERALEIDPHSIDTLDNFAYRLAACHREELRDYERAIGLAERGCQLTKWKDLAVRRTLAIAYMNSATALKSERQFARAIENYCNAIEADPDYVVPLFNLALLLATCSDERFRHPHKAVPLAERACQLVQYPDSIHLSILAEVYAEAARFDDAAAAIEKAIQLAAPAAGNTEWTNELRRRLKLYQNRALKESPHE